MAESLRRSAAPGRAVARRSRRLARRLARSLLAPSATTPPRAWSCTCRPARARRAGQVSIPTQTCAGGSHQRRVRAWAGGAPHLRSGASLTSRRMVGIMGGLSRETPSPANANEPRPPQPREREEDGAPGAGGRMPCTRHGRRVACMCAVKRGGWMRGRRERGRGAGAASHLGHRALNLFVHVGVGDPLAPSTRRRAPRGPPLVLRGAACSEPAVGPREGPSRGVYAGGHTRGIETGARGGREGARWAIACAF